MSAPTTRLPSGPPAAVYPATLRALVRDPAPAWQIVELVDREGLALAGGMGGRLAALARRGLVERASAGEWALTSAGHLATQRLWLPMPVAAEEWIHAWVVEDRCPVCAWAAGVDPERPGTPGNGDDLGPVDGWVGL